jgi:penicillin-binding protein 1A
MKLALADKPPTPFKVPAGIRLVRIDSKSGMRPAPGDTGRTILEAFKPGTAPAENYVPVSVAEGEGRMPMPPGYPPDAGNVQGMPPDAGNIMRPGTGRLY